MSDDLQQTHSEDVTRLIALTAERDALRATVADLTTALEAMIADCNFCDDIIASGEGDACAYHADAPAAINAARGL